MKSTPVVAPAAAAAVNGSGNAEKVAVDGDGTGPARTRAGLDRTPDLQPSEANHRSGARRAVRSTASVAPEADPNPLTKEDTPNTARIAAEMSVVTNIAASTVTETARRVTARTILAIVVVAATAEVCVAEADLGAATPDTTRAVVTANVGTCPSKDPCQTSTDIRWAIITITTRLS